LMRRRTPHLSACLKDRGWLTASAGMSPICFSHIGQSGQHSLFILLLLLALKVSSSDMSSISKQRKQALAARRQLSTTQRRRASVLACRRLARLPALKRAIRIGIYQPLASEIDPRPLMTLLADPARHFYFPRTEDNRVRFVPVQRNTRWRRSPLGMDEPAGREYAVSILDVLILPLAGFDHAAH